MVVTGVWCVPTLGPGALILCYNLFGTGLSTLGGAVTLSICSTLVGATGLFKPASNRVSSCLRDSNGVSPIYANVTSGLGCSSSSYMYAAASEAQYNEDMNGVSV